MYSSFDESCSEEEESDDDEIKPHETVSVNLYLLLSNYMHSLKANK